MQTIVTNATGTYSQHNKISSKI